ncbi:TPA: hypothetical protein L3H17_002967 [Morganella morganii]|nr:hypothetical protein [Morganella morganii]
MNFTDLPEKAREQAYIALTERLGKAKNGHGFACAKKDAYVVASAFIELYRYSGEGIAGRVGSSVTGQ